MSGFHSINVIHSVRWQKQGISIWGQQRDASLDLVLDNCTAVLQRQELQARTEKLFHRPITHRCLYSESSHNDYPRIVNCGLLHVCSDNGIQ